MTDRMAPSAQMSLAVKESRWAKIKKFCKLFFIHTHSRLNEDLGYLSKEEFARLDIRQTGFLHARKEILDWQDRWVENIEKQLERELLHLLDGMNSQIDGLSYKDTSNLDNFIDKHLAPVFEKWIRRQTEDLMSSAQVELRNEVKYLIKPTGLIHRLRDKRKNRAIVDVAKAGLSTGATIAAIPTAISLSTTTVSAGGLLGFFGATATIVVWPVAIIGAGIVGTLAVFSGKRIQKIKENARSNLKVEIRDIARAKILYSRDDTSLCQHLQGKIEECARMTLKELSHAR